MIRNKILNSQIEDVRDQEGNGLLLILLKKCYINKEIENLVKLLLIGEHKDNINQTNNKGETPLIAAAKYDGSGSEQNVVNIMYALLAVKNINAYHKDTKGNTAFQYVLSNKRKERHKVLSAYDPFFK